MPCLIINNKYILTMLFCNSFHMVHISFMTNQSNYDKSHAKSRTSNQQWNSFTSKHPLSWEKRNIMWPFRSILQVLRVPQDSVSLGFLAYCPFCSLRSKTQGPHFAVFPWASKTYRRPWTHLHDAIWTCSIRQCLESLPFHFS